MEEKKPDVLDCFMAALEVSGLEERELARMMAGIEIGVTMALLHPELATKFLGQCTGDSDLGAGSHAANRLELVNLLVKSAELAG